MKKSFILLSVMAVAAIASCVKEQPVDVKEETKGVPFEFTASTVDTKTTNDGMVTSWKVDDKINLFHAEASTTDYSGNDEFTITSENLAAKKFTGTLASALDPAKSYDWYALYPYNEAFTTPANTTGYVTIGGSSRTQNGYDNAEHLGGLPLVGLATDVDAADKPAITMNHMAAVLKIVVTNSTSEELTVTNVSFTAPVNITGQFIVDFSDPANPAYSDGTYCNDYCNLKVNSGTALGNGESATFYIPIKPVTLAKDSEISLKVNTYTKAVTMPSAFTFTPGKMTTINFDYDKTFTSETFYHSTSIAAGDKVIITGGTTGSIKVMGHYASGDNIASVAGTVTSGCVNSTSSMGVFTVGGNSTDGYTFYDAETETYLNATSTTSKSVLRGVATLDSYAYWAVSFDEGAAVITNKGKASRHIIRVNSSGTPFNAYTSGQDPVYLFKYDSRTPVTLSFATSSVSKTTANYGEFTGQTATASPIVTPITYTMTGDAIGTVNSSTGAVELNGTTGTATVTATYAGNVTHREATASYTITVSSVASPTTGSILFSCDFGLTNNLAFANYTGGTSWNNASTLTYSVSDTDRVFISTASAGNMTSGNLYFNGKNNSAGYTATIAGIKTYGATNVTVFWAANNASSDLEVTESSTAKTTSANSASNRQVFALTGTEETITLVFSNNAAANTRVDNVTVKFGNVTE